MKTSKNTRAFTLPEVVLAIGVVAFGLVGVFSILPYGLTAQKDNREETIIRYEAHYWAELLQADGVLLDDLNYRVDRVELDDWDANASRRFSYRNPWIDDQDGNNPGRVWLYNMRSPSTGAPQFTGYPTNTVGWQKARDCWSSDVAGWLLNPITIIDPSKSLHEQGNFALVKSLNGSLFDRMYGAMPASGDVTRDESEFTMGYIIRVTPLEKGESTELKIGFYWPIFGSIFEEIKDWRLQRTPALADVIRASMEQEPLNGGAIPLKFKHREFVVSVPSRLAPTLTENNLTPRERAFLVGISSHVDVGGVVTQEKLDEAFPVIDSRLRGYQVNTDPTGTRPMTIGRGPNGWPFTPDRYSRAPMLEVMTYLDGLGPWHAKSSGMQLIAQNKPHEIAWVDYYDDVPVFSVTNNVNGAYIILNHRNTRDVPYLPQTGPYSIRYLRPEETWGLKLKEFSQSRVEPFGGFGSRPALLLGNGAGEYVLNATFRPTLHKQASPDERGLFRLPNVNSHFLDNPDAPKQHYFVK